MVRERSITDPLLRSTVPFTDSRSMDPPFPAASTWFPEALSREPEARVRSPPAKSAMVPPVTPEASIVPVTVIAPESVPSRNVEAFTEETVTSPFLTRKDWERENPPEAFPR